MTICITLAAAAMVYQVRWINNKGDKNFLSDGGDLELLSFFHLTVEDFFIGVSLIALISSLKNPKSCWRGFTCIKLGVKCASASYLVSVFVFFFMCSKNIFYLKKNIVHFLVFFNNFNGLILNKKIILI
jgi:hypothetical protein